MKSIAAMLSAFFVVANGWGMQAGQGPQIRLAEGDHYVLTARGGLMLQSGEARELVFDGRHKQSELIWDISDLLLAGGSVSVQIGESFQLNAAGWVSVLEGNGSMEDYDWFIEGDRWTHYSVGDVDINEAYVFDVNGTYTFHRGNDVQLYGILGYKRLSWDWSEYGRSYIYSVNGFRDSYGHSGGVNGIDYQQTFDVPYAGLGAYIQFGRKSSGTFYALYSPIVQAEDRDHHILRGIKFKETFKNINYFGAGGELSMYLTDSIFFTYAVDAHIIPEARGDLEAVEISSGDTMFEKNAAGIENAVVAMTLSVGIRL